MNVHMLLILITLKSSFAKESEGAACGNPNEALYVNSSKVATEKQEPISICPAPPKKEANNLDASSNQYSELKYCLYEKSSAAGNKGLCEYEAKPVLYRVRDKNDQPVGCGTKKTQFLHDFGYLHCSIMDKDQADYLEKSGVTLINDILIEYIPMYTLCYDISVHQTIWTMHQITAPIIFINPTYKDEKLCPTKISTDPFYPDSKKHFMELEYNYEKEKNDPITSFPMKPQRIVPAEHFALLPWKKTTNHYVNVAPLWDSLADLMTAIDEGIKNSAMRVFLENIKLEKPHPGLIIYTAVKSALSLRDKFFKWLFRDKDYFTPNIWHKFVYDPAEKQGILIYVRNFPGKHVSEKKRKENLCDFKAWTDNEEIRDKIRSHLLERYAYCEKVSSKKVEKIFSMSVELEKQVLDIGSLSESYISIKKSLKSRKVSRD